MYVLKSTQKNDMQQNNAENPNSRKTLCKKTLMWTVRIYVMGKGETGHFAKCQLLFDNCHFLLFSAILRSFSLMPYHPYIA